MNEVQGSPAEKAGARALMRTGLRVVAALAALGVAWLAREVLLLGFFAVVLAVVLSFPVKLLARFLPRGVAVVAVLLVGLGLAAGLGAATAPTLTRQLEQVAETGPRAIQKARRWLEGLERKVGVAVAPRAPASEGGRSQGGGGGDGDDIQPVAKLAEVGLSAAGGVVRTLVKLLLIVVLAAFLVYEPDVYRRGLRRLVPREREQDFDELWTRLGSGLRHWVGGILVSMILMGTLTALGLLACGIQGWLLLGVLTFLGTFVPYLGAVASAVPGLLVALAQSPRHFLLALAVYVGVHIAEGYLVEPVVMRRAVEIKPGLLLTFQALAGAVFGIVGVVVATPALACLQVAVGLLWVERRLGKTASANADA